MILKPMTRYYVVNAMFVISIIYLLFFGILFGFNPNFLSINKGYEWFPYRLWFSKRNLFRVIGIIMIIFSGFLGIILVKFNERLLHVQQMINYSVHFSARNFPVMSVSFLLITIMKFSILAAILKCLSIMQGSEPTIEPTDCKYSILSQNGN